MAKYAVWKEEIWPEYDLVPAEANNVEHAIEVSDEEYAEFLRAGEAWNEVQIMIGQRLREAENA